MGYTIKDEGNVYQQIAEAPPDVVDEFAVCLHALEDDPLAENEPNIHRLMVDESDPPAFSIDLHNGFVTYRVEGNDVILMRYVNPWEGP